MQAIRIEHMKQDIAPGSIQTIQISKLQNTFDNLDIESAHPPCTIVATVTPTSSHHVRIETDSMTF